MPQAKTPADEQAEVNSLIQQKEWLKLSEHLFFLHVANQQQLTALIGKLKEALPTLPQGLNLEEHEFAILLLRSILKKRAVTPEIAGDEPVSSVSGAENTDSSRQGQVPIDKDQYIAYLEEELTRAEEGIEESQAVNKHLTKELELARAFSQGIPMTIESTFNCPECNALQQARKDNLSSVFSCSSCGHKSKYTVGELDWFQYRREHPDMPMPLPPDETISAAACPESEGQGYRRCNGCSGEHPSTADCRSFQIGRRRDDGCRKDDADRNSP